MPIVDSIQQFEGYSSARLTCFTPFQFLSLSIGTIYGGTYNAFVKDGRVRYRNKFNGYDSEKEAGIKKIARYTNETSTNLLVADFATTTSTDQFEEIKFNNGATVTLTSLTNGSGDSDFPMKTEMMNDVLYISRATQFGYKYFRESATTYFQAIGLPQASISAASWQTSPTGDGGFEAGDTAFRVCYVQKRGTEFDWQGPASEEFEVATTAATNGYVAVSINRPPNSYGSAGATHARFFIKPPSKGFFSFLEDVALSPGSGTTNINLTDGSIYDETRRLFAVNDLANEYEENTRLEDTHYGLVNHLDRMFYLSTDGYTLWYSEVLKPESVPSANFLIVGTKGDPFTEVISSKGALWIIKRYSIWKLTGSYPGDFAMVKVAHFGSFFPNMTFVHDGFMYGANQIGIWRWGGDGEPDYISKQIQRDWDNASISWPSRTTNTYTAVAYDLDQGYSKAVESRFMWTLDKQTGYLWFDCAYDETSDCFLGCYVYDPALNRFMGRVVFPHNALSNIPLSEGNQYSMCGFGPASSNKYSVYVSYTGSSVWGTDWESLESTVQCAVCFGGLVDSEFVPVKVGHIKVCIVGGTTFDLYHESFGETINFIGTTTIDSADIVPIKIGKTGVGGVIILEHNLSVPRAANIYGLSIGYEGASKW